MGSCGRFEHSQTTLPTIFLPREFFIHVATCPIRSRRTKRHLRQTRKSPIGFRVEVSILRADQMSNGCVVLFFILIDLNLNDFFPTVAPNERILKIPPLETNGSACNGCTHRVCWTSTVQEKMAFDDHNPTDNLK